MALLEIDDLKVYFGAKNRPVQAVDGVSLSIAAGKGAALVGESGCGKSVTALAIAKLVPQPPGWYAGGAVRFQNEDVLTLPNRKLRELRGGRIAYIFQEPSVSLNPVMRVGQQIAEALRLHQPKLNRAEEVIRLLTRVGLPDPERRQQAYPHQLSGGQQQRVMIAMALASRPDLLIADEPTTALDVTIQAEIIRLLCELRDEYQMAVLLITHNLGLVADVAEVLHVMYAGQIVESGPSREVLAQPAHTYTEALLAAVPGMQQTSGRLLGIPGQVPAANDWPVGCRFHPRCFRCEARCKEETPAAKQLGTRRVSCLLCDTNF